jgi:hypothetical protein
MRYTGNARSRAFGCAPRHRPVRFPGDIASCQGLPQLRCYCNIRVCGALRHNTAIFVSIRCCCNIVSRLRVCPCMPGADSCVASTPPSLVLHDAWAKLTLQLTLGCFSQFQVSFVCNPRACYNLRHFAAKAHTPVLSALRHLACRKGTICLDMNVCYPNEAIRTTRRQGIAIPHLLP